MNSIDDILGSEVDLIYEKIIKKSKRDENGIFWELENIKKSEKIDESIYLGISGIILFLIEYYKFRKNPKTLHIIDNSSQWLGTFCKNNPTNNYAFYTGRLGSLYTLIKAHKLIKNPTISFEFKQIEGVLNIINNKGQIHDFLNGTSGIILGLLHIYDEIKDEKIKNLIFILTSFLIRNTNIREYGYFWDKAFCIKGLCGFSHGSSGIGFVFLELGKYFNNNLFLEIAKKSFQYETYFYNEKIQNWPDFRHGYYDEETQAEYIDHFENGNFDFFHKPGYMSAWCHGAPGIGLTRIRAYEILQEEKYKEDIIHAYNNTEAILEGHLVNSHSLCHGTIGNSILLLEMYKLLKEKKYLDFNKKIALKAIQHRIKYKYYKSNSKDSTKLKDLGLFIGISGIGYSFLQSLDPHNTFSFLLPKLNGNDSKEFMKYDEDMFMKEIINKYYPLTCNLISGEKIKKLKSSNKIIPEITLNNIIDASFFNKNSNIEFIYKVENEKSKLEEQITSYTFYDTQRVVNLNHLQSLIDKNDLENSILYLNPQLKFFRKTIKGEKKIIIIYPDIIDVKLLRIDNLLLGFLQLFRIELTLKEIILKFLLENKLLSINKSELIIQTIKLIKKGIIFVKK